ncbi:MarR family winged helix-turn-helix transcriptional regulator [Nocardioides solisilvae]|uniref:MarR family winged helix-turn-helix transcriptional regulator n=1 Tax=Nocardioides solisilvae TaxID=1542435 RepID=UPI000D743508|nr:MarR family winged helix-turn-helix transcriptional regulator [Nocardioides solisilvae]
MTGQRHPVRDQTLDGLEREVARLVRRTRRAIGARARLVHPDLHPAAYLMLALVADRGPLRPSVISELFELDKGAVSRQVQQLVDLGLVRRDPDPDDRRASILTATEAAVQGMAQVHASRRALLRERLGEWDDAALADFVARLESYNEALEPGL